MSHLNLVINTLLLIGLFWGAVFPGTTKLDIDLSEHKAQTTFWVDVGFADDGSERVAQYDIQQKLYTLAQNGIAVNASENLHPYVD